jgi:preprotein translocase subunit SecG
MAIAYYVMIVLHIIACLFLIGVVLLQQGKSQDLASAFGGGGSQAAFGPRAGANVLTRATTILAGVFMVTSLALTILRPTGSGVLDRLPETAASPSPAAAAPAAAPVASPAAAAPVTQAPAVTQPAAPASPAAQ